MHTVMNMSRDCMGTLTSGKPAARGHTALTGEPAASTMGPDTLCMPNNLASV